MKELEKTLELAASSDLTQNHDPAEKYLPLSLDLLERLQRILRVLGCYQVWASLHPRDQDLRQANWIVGVNQDQLDGKFWHVYGA